MDIAPSTTIEAGEPSQNLVCFAQPRPPKLPATQDRLSSSYAPPTLTKVSSPIVLNRAKSQQKYFILDLLPGSPPGLRQSKLSSFGGFFSFSRSHPYLLSSLYVYAVGQALVSA
jgi:hypothetical protein